MVDNRGRDRERRSFPEVREAASSMSRRLRAAGVAPGDRVLICLSTSWDWVDCWFGAVLLGAAPCAIATPGALGSPAAQLDKTLRVCQRIDARLLVGPESFLREARRVLDDGFASRELGSALRTELLEVERLAVLAPAASEPEPDPDATDTAYLQLTSGSTGLPRAVELSHGAALHNAIACAEGVSGPHGELSQEIVSWLPLYHDMGLVGCLLHSVVTGIELALMSPRTFLGRPRLWLERISRSGSAVSPAPNFAYQLCVERAGATSGLDLSAFRDAITGSEMVRPETVEGFCSTFAAAGFLPGGVRPAYGLAEATLVVTIDQRLEGARVREVPVRRAGELEMVVSNGSPVRDTRIEIRSPAGRPLPSGSIGELWIRGPGLMTGYLGEPAATAEVLRDGWLDTGDLGFLDEDGDLYLTGRKKEILILQGHNVMPHELEWVAEGIAGGGGAERCGAFSVSSAGGERAVLVLETTEQDASRLRLLAHDVASGIGRALGVPLADLVLVRRGTLPRTSSGKIQRRALREAYLRGEVQSGRLDGAAGAPALPAKESHGGAPSDAT
jgi:fatty-acyl-CoA synthase